MDNKIIVHKQDFSLLGYVKRRRGHIATGVRLQTLAVAFATRVHQRALLNHVDGENAGGAVQTLFQDSIDACPSLVDEPIKHAPGKYRPQVLVRCPGLFLKQRRKVAVVVPEHMKDCVVNFAVLNQSNTFKRFAVEPVHIGVGVARITQSPIHFPPIHLPEVRDDVNVVLRNSTFCVFVDHRRVQDGFHCDGARPV